VKERKIVENIAIVAFILIIVSFSSILLKYRATTGKVIEPGINTFVAEFDDSTQNGWNPSSLSISTIQEEALDKEFKGIMTKTKTLLSRIDIPFERNEGIIWLRVKLDHANYDQNEFLPILMIGDMLLFKGATQEGHADETTGDNPPPPISEGKDIFIGSYYNVQGIDTGYYKKIGTWNKDEWHEIMISWMRTTDTDCESGEEHIVSIYVDGEIIPANSAMDCDNRCNDWTMWFCDELFFPISNTDYVIVLPDSNDVAQFDIQSGAQTRSGIFMEKLAITKEDINQTMYNLNDETITKDNFPYWSQIDEEIIISSEPSQQVLITGFKDKCRIFNKPGNRGTTTLWQEDYGTFQLDQSGNDLIIKNIQANLNTQETIVINCVDGTSSDTKAIDLTIGTPRLFIFYFIESGTDSTDISMEKESNGTVVYYVNHTSRDSIVLTHDVSGEGIVQELHYPYTPKLSRNHRVKLVSGLNEGSETLTVKITDDNTGDYITGEIHVTVLGDNEAPVVSIISPTETNIIINISEELEFRQTSYDDRTTTLEYKWYVNNVDRDQSNSYDFSEDTEDNYTVVLTVSDGELTTTKTWYVEVVEPVIPVINNSNNTNNTNNGTDNNSTSQAVCNDGVLTDPEECDGDYSIAACYGFACYTENCTCARPAGNTSTPHTDCGDYVLNSGEECDGNQRISACVNFNCYQQNCTCVWPDDYNNTVNQNNTTNNTTNNTNMGTNTTDGNNTDNTGTDQGDDNANQDNSGDDNSAGQGTDSGGSTDDDSGDDNSAGQGTGDGDNTYLGQDGGSGDDGGTGTGTSSKDGKAITSKSPKSNVVQILLWIFLGLCIIPFIILGASKLSKRGSKQGSHAPPINPKYDYKKMLKTMEWYKNRGMDAGSAYNMLTRMGFDQQHAYSIIHNTFYKNDENQEQD